MVEQKMRQFERWRRAEFAPGRFKAMFHQRLTDDSIKIGKALEANFYEPRTADEEQIKQYIDEYHRRKTAEWEGELFKQRKRLADAERDLKDKETKKALNDQRIAGSKIAQRLAWLADLKRTELKEEDSRIFPFWYAPVVVMEEGEYVVKPMRYHLRPNGKPAWYDKKYDGLYNARRDSLEKFWKNLFGRRHGVMLVSSFFENVALHDFEQRELRPGEKEKNLVLHFDPRPATTMAVACLWDHWQQPGQPDLYSFAAITDDPPPEVAATGHNRCILPLKDSNVEAWLTPEGRSREELYGMLDDRERPYYAHELAA
jgi:putative SOS response-associated peptidase YedK